MDWRSTIYNYWYQLRKRYRFYRSIDKNRYHNPSGNYCYRFYRLVSTVHVFNVWHWFCFQKTCNRSKMIAVSLFTSTTVEEAKSCPQASRLHAVSKPLWSAFGSVLCSWRKNAHFVTFHSMYYYVFTSLIVFSCRWTIFFNSWKCMVATHFFRLYCRTYCILSNITQLQQYNLFP